MKKEKVCPECDGFGEFASMEEVSQGEPQTMADVGSEICDECGGTGKVPDED